jgi:hypothetical protein
MSREPAARKGLSPRTSDAAARVLPVTPRKRIFTAASVAAVALAMTGCGSSTDTSSTVHTQHVTKATFTGLWPLTVDGGTIACDVSKGGSITFTPDGTGDVYAENGTAMGGWAKQEGWKDFHDIWLTTPGGSPGPRVDSGDLDAIGQKLCDEGYGSTAAATAATPTTTTTSAVESQPLPANLDSPLRGFMSKPPVWDQVFGAATADQCSDAGFDGLSPVSAWRLKGGALACVGDPALGAWDGRVVNLTVIFDPPVDAQSALHQIAAILPTDAQQSDTVTGHNSAAAADQTGTCADTVYTSAALGTAVSTVSPSWTGDTSKATVTLYSGGNADGSDSVFRDDAVHQALIGLHDSGPDPTGC